ncbi:MAG: VOC family protein [Thermoleophilaceae bacterium]
MAAPSDAPTVDSLAVADDADAWRAVGFDVDDDGTCRVGTVTVRIAPPDGRPGIRGWSVRGLATAEVDGLPTELSGAPAAEPAPRHPNGVATIDHLVAFTPDRARTAAALERAGLRLRRMRDEPTPAGGGFQAFFRLGEVILEVIEIAPDAPRAPEPDAPARFWGLAFGVDSLERATELLGEGLSEPRDAVQPGRRIATLRRSAGVGIPMAFMTPGPGAT